MYIKRTLILISKCDKNHHSYFFIEMALIDIIFNDIYQYHCAVHTAMLNDGICCMVMLCFDKKIILYHFVTNLR